MLKTKVQSVTTLSEAPEVERGRRIRNYAIAMSLRTLCVVAMVLLPSPWFWIAALGAIFLPYFAVVAANAAGPRSESEGFRSPKMAIAED